jgi:plastocyanin
MNRLGGRREYLGQQVASRQVASRVASRNEMSMRFSLTKRPRRWAALLAIAPVAAAVAVAGCGGSDGSPSSGSAGAGSPAAMKSAAPAAAQQVTITGTNSLRFTPMTVHLHAGAVRITLANMGAYPHNIVIPGLHVTSATVSGDPGASRTTFSVTFPHPGRYAFHCQYHQSAGMVGVFVVA